MQRFTDVPLRDSLQATLAEKGLTKPTEIQAKALPMLLGGCSLVAIAETGSGKTLTYVLPILNQMKQLEDAGAPVTEESRPRALVLVPTRELGEQVTRVFKPFTHTTRLRVRSVLGGTEMQMSRRNVQGMFEILVATPGRLLQLLDRKALKLDDVRTLIFDEADQMVDPGFLPDSNRIVAACTPERQLALFSATIPSRVQSLIEQTFGGAQTVRTEGSHRMVATLTTKNREVIDGERLPLLEQVLKTPATGGTLIFTNTREQCDKVAAQITEAGYRCEVYRGEMDRLQRRANLRSFRDGKVEILVSTDLASRGLDVDHVGRVVNYHLPKQMENYLHRVGRTARAGRPGLVINFVTKRDLPLIERLNEVRAIGTPEIGKPHRNTPPRGRRRPANGTRPPSGRPGNRPPSGNRFPERRGPKPFERDNF